MAAAREQEDRKLDGVKSFIKNSDQYRLLYSHGTTFNYYRAFLEQALTLLAWRRAPRLHHRLRRRVRRSHG